ncbi:unnamed protein product [Polarella glacialis]|uniref:Aldehyde dehydrogenase domain-containing protein n=1 Tax=Polarella glacialis TaxID=89957 RepID=A0A813G3I1_POLGL|nr:unnamed protein product [Polarella glacialis]
MQVSLRFAVPARRAGLLRSSRSFSAFAQEHPLPTWATVDPWKASSAAPAVCQNLQGGAWTGSEKQRHIIDPLNGENFLSIPDTNSEEAKVFAKNMKNVPKSGLHNLLKSPERYRLYGDVAALMAQAMRDPAVEAYFTRLIQRVVPKSVIQAAGEVTTVRAWLDSFAGDGVRQCARSFGVPGDRAGQISQGHRFPFGGVAIITPFNFPLEIPSIQMMSALFMGNRPLVKVDEKVAVVMEQFVRLAIHCGMPAEDADYLYSNGKVCNEVLLAGNARMTLFTGSQAVAEHLVVDLKGRVKLEDAGFDWKIIGPDADPKLLDYVAWQCDQDAYAFSGQKCSAQSVMFVHKNWAEMGLVKKVEDLAARRTLRDLTCSPVLSWTNQKILAHIDNVLAIPGARLAFGGRPLAETEPEAAKVPSCYGAFQPTAVEVPIEQAIKEEHFGTWTEELFGPFQIIIRYGDEDLDKVLECCERMEAHLTAAVVSNDTYFVNKVLASTVNGTTYAGYLARTTGAPQNHWFGPSNDPRSAGIHTIEAIQLCWSGHREIIYDQGPMPAGWTTPTAS